jgi:uncharacterized surface protein with fasciclin (FAS1) repeats
MIHRSSLFLAAALTAVLASGCATVAAPPTDVVSTAARTPELSTLSRLIQEAGLADTLRAAGPYTVFAPSNDAFKAVPAKTLEELSRNKEQLKAVLSYHVLPAKVSAAEVKVGNAKTVQGANPSRASTITRSTGSVPEARISTRPARIAQLALHLAARGRQRRVALPVAALGQRTLIRSAGTASRRRAARPACGRCAAPPAGSAAR